MARVAFPVPHVPAHLRRFVVEQDYGQYNAVDQAVWRFVLLQTHARLVETAHPAYREGLAATGISVEHIPSIAEMNDKLSRFGWGAVCVDGFIPPRAFQAFQACRILPIAADVRTRQHLVYTPAPDIIHEAAGHAPIVPDPTYAAYLERIGEAGQKAFTLPEEDRVYRALYTLSEVKEDPSCAGDEIAGAEAELIAAVASVPETSEAARMSRLYWWTAEYGLVGRTDDYKLYGAGLLSSLGESNSCHDPGVRKIVLDEGCTDVGYDVTRPQPQLFVAKDFDALHEVLDRVTRSLAFSIGGTTALGRALASRELASVQFSSGVCVMGVVAGVGPTVNDQPAWIRFDGRVGLAWDGSIHPAQAELERPTEQWIVCGDVEGDPLSGSGSGSGTGSDGGTGSGSGPERRRFRYANGAVVEGHVERTARHPDGRLMHVELGAARLTLPGRAPVDLERYVLVLAGRVVTAQAGAIDPRYHPDTPFASIRVPKPRTLGQRDLALLCLYQQAEAAHRAGASAMRREFPQVHAELTRDFSDEWLARWNLLESLLKVGDDGPLTRTLREELEHLEIKLDRREPIASGLRYLDRRAA